ncbi:hypothetical protein BDEG_26998 [Batrachochytrium dendrobatidis JEL423]|uniref:BTB domain-containing protein n=1 Tax=Batrachochytrium dendrobatidis (strain JEL423) TaxID=403673 RepID=A0A177WU69_BATDL|nr:hypothetical protein BDEG_26998 [Batrachochytrium dendrobatidis JEL423]
MNYSSANQPIHSQNRNGHYKKLDTNQGLDYNQNKVDHIRRQEEMRDILKQCKKLQDNVRHLSDSFSTPSMRYIDYLATVPPPNPLPQPVSLEPSWSEVLLSTPLSKTLEKDVSSTLLGAFYVFPNSMYQQQSELCEYEARLAQIKAVEDEKKAKSGIYTYLVYPFTLIKTNTTSKPKIVSPQLALQQDVFIPNTWSMFDLAPKWWSDHVQQTNQDLVATVNNIAARSALYLSKSSISYHTSGFFRLIRLQLDYIDEQVQLYSKIWTVVKVIMSLLINWAFIVLYGMVRFAIIYHRSSQNLKQNDKYYNKKPETVYAEQKSNAAKEVITIWVGGIMFQTKKETLAAAKGSVLSLWTRNETIFIDRDGRHFYHILNHLRGVDTINGIKDLKVLEEISIEAQYYRLHVLNKHVQNLIQQLS